VGKTVERWGSGGRDRRGTAIIRPGPRDPNQTKCQASLLRAPCARPFRRMLGTRRGMCALHSCRSPRPPSGLGHDTLAHVAPGMTLRVRVLVALGIRELTARRGRDMDAYGCRLPSVLSERAVQEDRAPGMADLSSRISSVQPASNVHTRAAPGGPPRHHPASAFDPHVAWPRSVLRRRFVGRRLDHRKRWTRFYSEMWVEAEREDGWD